MECLRLRIQDLDFDRRAVVVRDGNGRRDRMTVMPGRLREALERQIAGVKVLHRRDLADGFGEVDLPDALARKYPNASKDFLWRYLVPASRLEEDEVTGRTVKGNLRESAISQAGKAARVSKRVTCHALRHGFATHLLEAGTDRRTIQRFWGTRISVRR